MATHRHRPTAVLLTVAALLIAGCGSSSSGSGKRDTQGLPLGLVSYQEVKSHPEATLYYPGSEVVRVIGSGEVRNYIEGGSNSAFAGAILRTDDTPERVYAWYRAWVVDHGWQTNEVSGASPWLSAQGYQRGSRERFLVAIDNPVVLSQVLGSQVPTSGTLFETRYTIIAARSG